MKKISFLVALYCAIAVMNAGVVHAEKKIGILLFNDQPRYVENEKGVIDALKKQGFSEPTVKFTVENAGGNKAKAVELVRKFAADKMDMIIPIGTSGAVAAANEVKDIPIIFVMVWDPVESKIAQAWSSSGNNTTGASSKTSAAKLLSAIKELRAIKSVAVLYTPGEKNTEIQLKEFMAEQANFQIKIIPVPLSRKEEAAQVLPDVVGAVQAICLTGSSVVGEMLPLITDLAKKASVITASQSEDHVEGGVLLGVTVNAYAVGHLAGEKAAKVLKGAKPSAIPIESLKNMDLIMNMKVAKEGKFDIPASFMKQLTRTID